MTKDNGVPTPVTADVARARVDGKTGRITLLGEIDHGSVERLDNAVCELLDAGVTRLVVDFERLSFFDSACISALVRARAKIEEGGGTLVLTNVGRYARRILDLTGLLSVFTIEDAEDAADAEKAEKVEKAGDPSGAG